MSEHLVKFEWQVSEGGHCFAAARFTGGLRFSRGGFLFSHGYRETEGHYETDVVVPFLLPTRHQEADPVATYDPNLFYERMPSPLGLEGTPTYEPFQDAPALYREFALLDLASPMPEILKFADKWGMLGGDASVQVDLVDDEWKFINDKKYLWAETPGIWLDEIIDMRMALEIWDMVRLKDREALHSLISWENGEVFWEYEVDCTASDPSDDSDFFWVGDIETGKRHVNRSDGRHDAGYVSTDEYHPERRDNLTPGDPESAARYIVGDLVNKGLEGRVSAQLGPRAGETSPVIRLVPDSLIGALWLQFTIAVDGNLDYKRCEECQMWLEIAPGAGRPDKNYCSDACRMRAYRKRTKAKKHTVSLTVKEVVK